MSLRNTEKNPKFVVFELQFEGTNAGLGVYYPVKLRDFRGITMYCSPLLRTMLKHVRDDEALLEVVAKRMGTPSNALEVAVRAAFSDSAAGRFDAIFEDPGRFVREATYDEFVEKMMAFHTSLLRDRLGRTHGRWASDRERRLVVDFVEGWTLRTGIPRVRFMQWLEISQSKYFGWRSQVEEEYLELEAAE